MASRPSTRCRGVEPTDKREQRCKYPSRDPETFFKIVFNEKILYVPAGFAMKNLSSESITLQDSDGKRFPARCFDREGSGAGTSIGKGWATFAREHDLEEGDVLVFELIKRETIVLKVHIFRAIDYAGM